MGRRRISRCLFLSFFCQSGGEGGLIYSWTSGQLGKCNEYCNRKCNAAVGRARRHRRHRLSFTMQRANQDENTKQGPSSLCPRLGSIFLSFSISPSLSLASILPLNWQPILLGPQARPRSVFFPSTELQLSGGKGLLDTLHTLFGLDALKMR